MDFGNTHYIEHESGKEINLAFPSELLTNTAQQLDFSISSLTIDNVRELFIVFIGKWIEGSVSTEDLSSVSNYFLTVTKYKDEELSAKLMDASELSYYIRHTNHESGEPLHGFVTSIREYHSKFS
jgi:hypothetical protein